MTMLFHYGHEIEMWTTWNLPGGETNSTSGIFSAPTDSNW